LYFIGCPSIRDRGLYAVARKNQSIHVNIGAQSIWYGTLPQNGIQRNPLMAEEFALDIGRSITVTEAGAKASQFHGGEGHLR
jgi:hypothetical protein